MPSTTINYINKDYESIRQELISRIPQLTENWTNYNSSDLGIVLLDLFAGVGDMLAYYIDSQSDIDTSTDKYKAIKKAADRRDKLQRKQDEIQYPLFKSRLEAIGVTKDQWERIGEQEDALSKEYQKEILEIITGGECLYSTITPELDFLNYEYKIVAYDSNGNFSKNQEWFRPKKENF